GFPANHISRWNGSFWQELYYGTNNDVYALYAKDSNLYVGGQFTQVGTGTIANCIAVWVYQPVGIEEQGLNRNIQVFPNPSSGTFRVLLEPDQNKDPNTEIKVWNALGALIYAGKMQNNMAEISLSNSPKGIYFIQIQADKLFYTSKLVIE
ncbi:MAG: T9SS type A sorting domain-containing protein, partial [Bacteroidia bacterium]|nr:T9SS type A sorting domain-containing protein [Bacteroidia bacterium]